MYTGTHEQISISSPLPPYMNECTQEPMNTSVFSLHSLLTWMNVHRVNQQIIIFSPLPPYMTEWTKRSMNKSEFSLNFLLTWMTVQRDPWTNPTFLSTPSLHEWMNKGTHEQIRIFSPLPPYINECTKALMNKAVFSFDSLLTWMNVQSDPWTNQYFLPILSLHEWVYEGTCGQSNKSTFFFFFSDNCYHW